MPYVSDRTKARWRNPLVRGVAKKAAKFVAKTVAGTAAANYGGTGLSKYLYKRDRGRSKPGVPTGQPIVIQRARAGGKRRRNGAAPPRFTGRQLAGPVPYINPSKLRMIRKMYPHRLSQTYYIQSQSTYVELEAGKQGTITGTDQIYSTASTDPSNASLMLFNVSVTENHWFPHGVPASQGVGYRTGNQTVGVDNQLPGYGALGGGSQNDSFIYKNNATSTNLQSAVCPMYQNGLAESAADYISNSVTHFYNIPNNVLESLHYKLRFSNPLIAPQKLSIKVVRYDNGDETPLHPGAMSDTQVNMESHIRTLCNAGTWTGRGFKTLHSQTVSMPGLRGGTKQQFFTVTKSLPLNYLRSQYRKTYNATSMGTLGIQAKPSFGLADDGFFNAVYIVVSSVLTTDTYVATVEVEKNATNPETKETGIPQINNYPPIGLTTAGYKTIGAGAQFGVSGTVSVHHRVKDTQRAIGHAASSQLNALTKQITDLKQKLGDSEQCESEAPPAKKSKNNSDDIKLSG